MAERLEEEAKLVAGEKKLFDPHGFFAQPRHITGFYAYFGSWKVRSQERVTVTVCCSSLAHVSCQKTHIR